MCGISAFLGKNKIGYLTVLEGLKMLQNRGYDSAGIASFLEKKIEIEKYASTKTYSAIKNLELKTDLLKTNLAIGHTRWATHGPKTDYNAHPHMDYTGKIVVVHNGIIENYFIIKEKLKDLEIKFKSDTDTEVISNLLGYNYKKNGDFGKALSKTFNELEGTWGCVIINLDFPNTLYCAKNGSPLLLGINKDYIIVSSEQSGFINKIKKYVCLKDKDIVKISLENGEIKTPKFNNMKNIDYEKIALTPDPYPHWTLKEIMEQIDSVNRAINYGGRIYDDYNVKLGGLEVHLKELINLDHLVILGCGTSLNAGNIGRKFFLDLECFDTVQVIDGAEFEEKDIPKKGKIGLLLLSQSGETKDLHRCMNISKNVFIFSIVNVIGSLIAREAKCGVYLNAGKEIGVASTKSFTNQVVVLALVAIWFAQNKKKCKNKRKEYISGLRNLSKNIKELLSQVKQKNYQIIAKYLLTHPSTFILGKSIANYIAIEGALKLKEISYIHAEGYSGSALKHGPFALLCKDFPVISIVLNNIYKKKMLGCIEEIKSRYATNIVITDFDIKNKNICDMVVKIPKNKIFADLLAIIPIQMIAYKLSLLKNINPDFPKNLAKVVTVE